MTTAKENNRWLIGLVVTTALVIFGMLTSWLSWLTLTIVTHGAKIEAITLTQSNVIPPIVETSLREIRDKTNGESKGNSEATAKLMQIAVENSKDIGYIKSEIVKLQNPK